jgi:hypothetical protein
MHHKIRFKHIFSAYWSRKEEQSKSRAPKHKWLTTSNLWLTKSHRTGARRCHVHARTRVTGRQPVNSIVSFQRSCSWEGAWMPWAREHALHDSASVRVVWASLPFSEAMQRRSWELETYISPLFMAGMLNQSILLFVSVPTMSHCECCYPKFSMV